jgi:2-polyprenyl-6-methoxyphenol hydroxylase-like FAD-dependent oxidoreductase
MAGQPDAIALGSGPAALLAAAALDRQGFDVLILDQDQPPTADDEGRDDVPHGAQLHNILGRGQHISTSCFPAMWTPW